MRRLAVILGLAALGLPAPTEAPARDVHSLCATYCLFATAGCYAFFSYYMGPDKCDSFYEGCGDGCRAAAGG